MHAAAIADLGLARHAAAATEFAKLRTHWLSGRWLRARNRYQKDCIDQINKYSKPPNQLFPRHLAEYIAASSVCHLLDGWKYLGRATEAHLSGDPDAARHLAYYAELRAAMSLLACGGVGVFSKKHFVLPKLNALKRVRGESATHVFAWEALDQWAQNADGANLIFDSITPATQGLTAWLDKFSMTPGTHGLLAHAWIAAWGLDLKRLKDDREARNVASYRPTAFNGTLAMPLHTAVRFVTEMWRLSEPSTLTDFAVLDAHLLRNAVETKFRAVHPRNRSSLQAKKLYLKYVTSMVHQLGPAPAPLEHGDWIAFLTKNPWPHKPTLLGEAAGDLQPHETGHHVQVMARATLLLRLASGASKLLIQPLSAVERSALRFWWLPLAEAAGLWPVGNPPAAMSDLWLDVDEALTDLETWVATTPPAQQSAHALRTSAAAAASVVSGTARIGLWSLGL